jgi:hypothetical protein
MKNEYKREGGASLAITLPLLSLYHEVVWGEGTGENDAGDKGDKLADGLVSEEVFASAEAVKDVTSRAREEEEGIADDRAAEEIYCFHSVKNKLIDVQMEPRHHRPRLP